MDGMGISDFFFVVFIWCYVVEKCGVYRLGVVVFGVKISSRVDVVEGRNVGLGVGIRIFMM